MKNKNNHTIEDLFELFSDSLTPADVLTSKLMAQISSSITRERIKLHMNQTDFAKFIDATQSLVSRWEQGNYNFSIRKLAEIATKLGLDVNITLVDKDLYNPKESYSYDPTLTKTIVYSSSYAGANREKFSSSYTKIIQSKEEHDYVSVC